MMRSLVLRRWRPLVAMVPLLIVQSACGLTTAQKEAVSQFGRASTGFGAAVSTELVDMRNTVIDLNSNVLALAPKRLTSRDLDGAFTLRNVDARVRAANVLQTYGELLVALVEDTQAKELQTAAGNFTTSVRGLDPDKVRLSDADLDAAGKAVAAVGGLIVEHKKAQALKIIVPKAHPQVEQLGRLFAGEFEPEKGEMAVNFGAEVLKATGATDSVLDAERATVSDRAVAAVAYRKASDAALKAKAVFPDLHKGAVTMVAAHARLVEALANDRIQIDDIKSFAKTVQSLVASVRSLSNR
jgi:hypothetical protein